MTPLQALILRELQERGPMREVELWQKTTEPAITTVSNACISLEAACLIETPHSTRPVKSEWQLTSQGRTIAARLAQKNTIHEFAVKNMLVEKYLLCELKGADLEDFERHMFDCQICFEQVKAGRNLIEGIGGAS